MHDKLLDLWKGMCVLYVDALHGGFDVGRGIRGSRQASPVHATEVQYEQNKTVFPAIVRQG